MTTIAMLTASTVAVTVGPTVGTSAADVPACTSSTLSYGQTLTAGQCLVNGQFEMIMQTDGNLVIYNQSAAQPVWSSGTEGNPGAYATLSTNDLNYFRVLSASGGQLWIGGAWDNNPDEQLVLQSDGNLQLLVVGTSIWQSGIPSAAYSLLLQPGQSITSTGGAFQLLMQPDGNLVEYLVAQHDAVWSSRTQGNPGAVAVMQNDGNLVVYSQLSPEGGQSTPHVALWASGTTASNATLAVQADGNVVVYGTNPAGMYPLWSSHTNNLRGYELTSGQLLQPGQYLRSSNDQYILNMSSGGNLTLSSIGQYVCPLWSIPAITTPSSQAFTPVPGAYLQLTSGGDLALWHPGQSTGASMWDAGTLGGDSAVLQNDGNLVVYAANGTTALWTSGTDANRGTYLCAGSTLSPGQHVSAWNDSDSSNVSLQASSYLSMQSDCNLVLYSSGKAVWATGTTAGSTSGKYDGCYTAMQTDGNLVVYATSSTGGQTGLWSSGTAQSSAPPATPAIVGPYFLVPVISGDAVCSTTVSGTPTFAPTCPAGTTLVAPGIGTPNIYSFAGPLLGNPVPAKSGHIEQWVVAALNTLVFYLGAIQGPVGLAFSVLGTADTVVSDGLTYAHSQGGGTSSGSGGTGGISSPTPVPAGTTGAAMPHNVPAPITTCGTGSPDQLLAGGLLEPGGCLRSTNGKYALVMQADGNLVLYDQSRNNPDWATGTAGNPGAQLRLQSDDGNLVETNADGTVALWSTGTVGTPNPVLIIQNDGNLVLYGTPTGGGASSAAWSSATTSVSPIIACSTATSPDVLQSGQTLATGACLVSPNGQYALIMQSDGNLVLYYERPGGNGVTDVLWDTGTPDNPGAQLRLQSDDGNLVEYAPSGSVWASGTTGAANTHLVLQNDGNLVLYANNQANPNLVLQSDGTFTISTTANGNGAIPYAAWATGTQSSRGPVLPPGQVLQPGQYLQNGRFRLTMGVTGMLVLTQATAASTVCPMWTVPAIDAAASGIYYSYSGTFPFDTASTPPIPGAHLTMQADGNLVLDASVANAPGLFYSNTYNHPNAFLTLSKTGVLSIDDPGTVDGRAGVVLWQALPPNDDGLMLCAGGSLSDGQYITGDQPANGGFQLVMQSDCNLVLYGANGQGASWSSNTSASQAGQGKNPLSKSAESAGEYANCSVQMQTDGNLVMVAPNAPNGGVMWASNSEQPLVPSLVKDIGPYYLTTTSGGFAQIFNDLGTQVWEAEGGLPQNGSAGSQAKSTAQTIFSILGILAAFL